MRLQIALAVAASVVQALDQQQRPVLSPQRSFEPYDTADDVLHFELRHILHRGSTKYPELFRRLDIHQPEELVAVTDAGQLAPAPRYHARARPAPIERLSDRSAASIASALANGASEPQAWTIDMGEEPDVSDKETVLSLARMANDAYYTAPDSGEWKDIGGGFNYTEDFGWESDGLRGHIFADTTNRTVVMAMKGTSLPFLDPRGTISNDKLNDNLLFSCCCGQGGRWLWHQVCACQTEYHVGNGTCLAEEIRAKTKYYYLALELYHNVTELYPEANIWLAGHSLGGSVASLLGYTVGQPAVTFEAPADAMAADRLGLPTPPGFRLGNATDSTSSRTSTSVYHFGHTADDIFMGNCNAWNSVCTIGGYAMEAMCHTGSICIYDTVKDKGWSNNARSNHGIGLVIKDVIDTYDEVAACRPQTECRDCEEWKFFEVGDD